MKRITILTGLVGMIAAIFLASMMIIGSSFGLAEAQSEPETAVSGLRTIEVNGQGRVSAKPDRAILRLGVTTEAISATVALNENSMRMSDLISVTMQAGIPEDNIQTEGLRLQPIYASDLAPESQTRQLTGYRVSNIVAITTTDLDGLGELLDSVVEAGGNSIEGIRFEISNNEDLLRAAREAAVADARARAEQLTDLLGTELGDVQKITEFGSPSLAPIIFDEAIAGATAAVPISPGTQEIEVSIQVIWQLTGE